MVKGCIYIIKNSKNNAVYIGQTILPVKDRFSQHMKPSAHKKNYKFYRAISKLGKESFYYEVLEDGIHLDKLDEREIYYIEKYNSYKYGYNSTKGGDGRIINKIEDLDYIIRELKKGRFSSDIAEELGVSTATIKRALQREGLTPRDFIKVDRERVIKLYQIGLGHREIAKKMGINQRTVSRVVNDAGIQRKRKHYDYSNINDDDIVKDVNKGMKRKDIAEKYNISKDYIYKLLKKRGII